MCVCVCVAWIVTQNILRRSALFGVDSLKVNDGFWLGWILVEKVFVKSPRGDLLPTVLTAANFVEIGRGRRSSSHGYLPKHTSDSRTTNRLRCWTVGVESEMRKVLPIELRVAHAARRCLREDDIIFFCLSFLCLFGAEQIDVA